MAGFLGAGDLLFNRKVNGVDQGWLPFGNATKFEIKENSEIKNRKSKGKNDYGQTLDSAAIKMDAEISITLDDINADNMALLFLGTVQDVNVAAGTVTSEAATAQIDKSFKLANRKVTNVVITDSAGTTTYVENTDYVIENATLGLIKPLSTGAITDGQALLVSYSYAAVTSKKVIGGTDASIRVALMLDGENFATQRETLVTVYEAELSPQSGLDFLADDFTTLELSGTLITPTGATSAYEIEDQITYA